MRRTAQYTVTYGLAGCYMPDSVIGPLEFATRRELADFIRSELEFFDMPASLFRDVNIRKLWGMIQTFGSSVMHFSLRHGANELAFHGLTQAEFDAGEEE